MALDRHGRDTGARALFQRRPLVWRTPHDLLCLFIRHLLQATHLYLLFGAGGEMDDTPASTETSIS